MDKNKVYELSDDEIDMVVGGITQSVEFTGCDSFMLADGMPDTRSCSNCYYHHIKNGVGVCDKPTNQ